jgi:hypothetical protein
MTDRQRRANQIRDCLVENGLLHHLGVEILWAAAAGDRLTIRTRHRNRVLTVERAGAWFDRDPVDLAAELSHELVAEALGNRRAAHPSIPAWRQPAGIPPTVPVRPRQPPVPPARRP